MTTCQVHTNAAEHSAKQYVGWGAGLGCCGSVIENLLKAQGSY